MTDIITRLNNLPCDFYFLVVDKNLDISLPLLHNFYSLSPAKLNIKLPEKNSGRLLSHPVVMDRIRRHSASTGRRPVIVPFKPSAKIATICRQNSWLLAANPSSLNRKLEDKTEFYRLAESINLPLLPGILTTLSRSGFTAAQKKFGSRTLVVQSRFGWAGKGSCLSTDYDSILRCLPEGSPVKITPFKQGYSLINNCVLTSRGLFQSPPGLQYTGIAPLTSNPLATVGRQWPSLAPLKVRKQVKSITSAFAIRLSALGYRGYFGLDFLVHHNRVYLIECNPRLTASFAFYHAMEERAGLTSLFYKHLAAFTGLDDIAAGTDDRFDHPGLVGSEITLKDAAGTTVRKFHDFTAFSPSSDPVQLSSEVISRVL